MNKLLTALMLTAAMTLPTFADDGKGYEFYNNQSGNWHVGGYSGDPSLDPACYAEYPFQDSSVFQLIKDLASGEVYLYIMNVSWDIADAPGQYDLIMNFRLRNGNYEAASGKYSYQLLNKNTILINGLNVDEFIPSFMNATEIQLVMPGTIQNGFIPLDGSSGATTLLAECIKLSEQVKLTYPSSNNNNVVPDIKG